MADPADILLVDDTRENLRLLTEILEGAGHVVRPVRSGSMALTAAKASPPDLILLDINMPEMDGYQVCAAFKADPDLQDIPIIFISGLDSVTDKVRAFQLGGLDYISKPFQREEVLARVATHHKLHRYFKENAELAVLRERTRIAGDLHDEVSQTLAALASLTETLALMQPEDKEALQSSLMRIHDLARGAFSEMRGLLFELRPAALTEADLVRLIEHRAHALAARTRARVHSSLVHDLSLGERERFVFYRAAQEAINNVAKHAQASEVAISLQSEGGKTDLVVRDNGIGFDYEGVSLNHLGLRIMKERAESIDATLAVHSAVGRGTTIRLTWNAPRRR